MKRYRTDVFLLVSILIVAFLLKVLFLDSHPIDIQLHDTYYVFSSGESLLVVVGLLLFLVFLVRALATKFNNKAALLWLLIGLFFLVLISWGALQMQQNYVLEIERLETDFLPNKEAVLATIKEKIIGLWLLIGFWLATIAFVGFRLSKLR